jgi:hypothetical protein
VKKWGEFSQADYGGTKAPSSIQTRNVFYQDGATGDAFIGGLCDLIGRSRFLPRHRVHLTKTSIQRIYMEAMLSPRKRYSFWINDIQAAGLKVIKEAEDISESEQIRQAINLWLSKKGVSVKSDRKRSLKRPRS